MGKKKPKAEAWHCVQWECPECGDINEADENDFDMRTSQAELQCPNCKTECDVEGTD